MKLASAFFLVFLSAVWSLRAQDTLDKSELTKELDRIEEVRKGQLTGAYSSVIDELTAAMNDPSAAVELYHKAVFSNQFEGAKGDSVEFNRWKLQDGAKTRDPQFVATLQLHIEYLIYTLRKVGGEQTSDQINDLIAYVQKTRQLADNFSMDDIEETPKPKDQKATTKQYYDEFLHHSLSEGPFVKYYQIEKQLDDLQDWELEPLNSRGIEEKIIFPNLRDKKDKLLLQLWDQRIEYERQMSLKSGLVGDKTRFENDTYPSLLWNRAKDQVATGDQTGGMKALVGVLRSYPLHASFEDWLKEMRDLVATLPDPVPPPAAPPTPTADTKPAN